MMKDAIRRWTQPDRVLPILTIAVLIALWEWTVREFAISPNMLPPPSQVAAALWELSVSGVLFHYIIASLFRVTWGYFLAVATAIPIGLFLGLWPLGRAIFNPIIQFLRPISPLAWIPLAILWLGIGDRPAIFLIFLAVFFPMLVSVMGSVAGIKVTYLRIAQNFGLKGYRLYTKVILPAALPEIVTGLRITLGTAWLVIVAAEMIAVKSGLGYLIIDARNSLRMDQVMGGMVVIGIIGLGLDYMIRGLENLPSVRWKQMRK
ncbi:ABC transporter permease [Dissulfurimicrobium hydrothermale]|uniref:ABC transporter permease n=1 Tax=Dissulfurimicrobium hydrothermale TaxID=1750598 RepID=UPI001EDBEDC6|nr:ABC transporter permease [Dissulfurimicrobium hydrothermale]UKL14265.1 ABC transporter permease [Dissulfurimicrobium hydrothermale]